MKTINRLLPKIIFTPLLFLFFLMIVGCDNSKKIEDKVAEFQISIDSLLTNVVVPMKTAIDIDVLIYSDEGKDTFQLARQRIPITKIQFLMSNEYFELDDALKAYSEKRINETELSEQLQRSQVKVDSLVNYELKNIENQSLSQD